MPSKKVDPLPTPGPPKDEPPPSIPEWLEKVRTTVENEPPLIQQLLKLAIQGALQLAVLSDETAEEATRQPTPLSVLVRALASGELLQDLLAVEPLSAAFLRGMEGKQRLLQLSGGSLNEEQVAQRLRLRKERVAELHHEGRLIGLPLGRKGYRYPTWQFTESGFLPGLDQFLKTLETADEWTKVAFALSPNVRLGNRAPIELLRAGKIEPVLSVARAYGEHGAA